ncbi:MAG TPA: hypothetical protein VL492_05755, partial [Methylovirgula sp.]|nr:hypothetical protein [Methylovirgula sp.]
KVTLKKQGKSIRRVAAINLTGQGLDAINVRSLENSVVPCGHLCPAVFWRAVSIAGSIRRDHEQFFFLDGR